MIAKFMRNLIIGIFILVIAAGILWFLFGRALPKEEVNTSLPVSTSPGIKEPAPESKKESPVITLPSRPVKEFTIIGSNFKFSLGEIRVKKGDTVKIVFKNQQGLHNWQVDEFGAATKVIQAGEQDTIEFVADKTGQFEYYCSVMQHRKMGMKGVFVVE